MSIQSAPYYWLTCDNCGTRADYDDFAALDNPDDAIQAAIDGDWTTDGKRHHCPRCPVLSRCDHCNEPAGDDPGERDFHCPSCWAALEAENA